MRASSECGIFLLLLIMNGISTSLGHHWDIIGTSLGHHWDIIGTSLGHHWDIIGISLESQHHWDSLKISCPGLRDVEVVSEYTRVHM